MREMPAPSKTSRAAIVAAARALLEDEGLDAVTMQRVAERVGVRGPSLYKHVTDRAALVRAVGDAVTADLGRTIVESMASGDPSRDLRSMATAYRAFVHANPAGYRLLFAGLGADLRADPVASAEVGRPVVEATGRLRGVADPLAAARTVVAWAHGFVSMEAAGAFRLGGDVDAAYEAGIDLILAGISGRATPARA
jgi:AcrR family transcriptional regulator